MAIDVKTKVVLHTYEGHRHQRFALRACFGGLDDSFVISASEGESVLAPALIVSYEALTIQCMVPCVDNSLYLWSRQQRLPLEQLKEHDAAVCVARVSTNRGVASR